ncbi:MAG: hypothetical protein WBL45_13155 [Solirubrobacterales bacterium]
MTIVVAQPKAVPVPAFCDVGYQIASLGGTMMHRPKGIGCRKHADDRRCREIKQAPSTMEPGLVAR